MAHEWNTDQHAPKLLYHKGEGKNTKGRKGEFTGILLDNSLN